MSGERKHTVLRVIVSLVILLLSTTTGVYFWLIHPRKVTVQYKASTWQGHSHKKVERVKTTVKEEPNYEVLLRQYLPEFLEKATHGMYHMSIGDISADVPAGEIVIKELRLWPDSLRFSKQIARGSGPSHTWRLFVSSARITDVKWSSLLTDKELIAGQFLITHPVLTINRYRDLAGVHTGDNDNVWGKLQKIGFGRIKITDPIVTYNIRDGIHSSYYLHGGDIVLINWMVGNKPNDNAGPFFYAKSGALKFGTLEYKRPGLMYKINSSAVNFQTENNTLRLTGLNIAPLYAKEEYYRRIGVQLEMYTIHLPVVEFHGFNWKQLTAHNTLYASSMDLESPKIETYLSRFPPPNTQSRLETFPHQMLKKLKMRVNIRKVNVRDGYVKYTELNKQTNMEGVVAFDGIHGSIANVTNMPDVLKKNSHATAQLSGRYKGKSDVTTSWDLNLADPNGAFTLNGTLSNMDASDISEDSKALDMIAIRSLHVDKMDIQLHGNNTESSSTFTMLYNNLDVELEKFNKHGQMDDKDVSTWMTNHIYIFKQNPMPDDAVRTVTTSVPRDRMRSFFSAIWANIREGTDKTVIKDQQLAEKQAEGEDGHSRKKGAVKAFFKSIFKKKAH